MTEYEELLQDATRYRKMRTLAVEFRSLEAFVALTSLDFTSSQVEFDNVVDERVGNWIERYKP